MNSTLTASVFTAMISPILESMCKTSPGRCRWVPVVLMLCSLPAVADTVYRTVDENGVVSFSDARPDGDGPVETMVIDIPQPQPGEEQQERLQDMRETTDRMVADRMAREKHRAEMRKMQAETDARTAARDYPDYPQYPDSSTVYSGYGGYYNYPRRRPRYGHRPRPVHPIARPPLRPPVHGRPPHVRPLPSHDYPASLIRRSYNPKVRAALRH